MMDRSAACLISSLIRASEICCPRAGAARPPIAASAIAAVSVEKVLVRVIASLSIAPMRQADSAPLSFPALAPRAAVILVPLFVKLVEDDPLLGRQHLAHAQQHQRPRLVQRAADRFDLVHLAHNAAFVGVAGN